MVELEPATGDAAQLRRLHGLLVIHAMRAEPDRAPLVFHGSRFRQLADV